jgi:hypothetical protein
VCTPTSVRVQSPHMLEYSQAAVASKNMDSRRRQWRFSLSETALGVLSAQDVIDVHVHVHVHVPCMYMYPGKQCCNLCNCNLVNAGVGVN